MLEVRGQIGNKEERKRLLLEIVTRGLLKTLPEDTSGVSSNDL